VCLWLHLCPSSSVSVLTIFGTYIIRLLITGFESNSHCKDFFFKYFFFNSGRLGHRHARVCVQLAEEQPDDFRTQIVLVGRPGVLGPRRKARSGRKRKGQSHLGGKAFL
jgi:hypothetical protein